jgi:hypothetical protein
VHFDARTLRLACSSGFLTTIREALEKARVEFINGKRPGVRVGEVKRLDRESTCANVRHLGRNKMLGKTSLVLAIAAALMLPSASFGKAGDHRVGYHGRYYRHGVWGHCWPGGVWRYSGGWLGYGCWRWTPDGSICWICG